MQPIYTFAFVENTSRFYIENVFQVPLRLMSMSAKVKSIICIINEVSKQVNNTGSSKAIVQSNKCLEAWKLNRPTKRLTLGFIGKLNFPSNK